MQVKLEIRIEFWFCPLFLIFLIFLYLGNRINRYYEKVTRNRNQGKKELTCEFPLSTVALEFPKICQENEKGRAWDSSNLPLWQPEV